MDDLFGDGENGDGATRPKKRPGARSDGVVQRCIDAYFRGFVGKFNPPATPTEQLLKPIIHGGKDGAHFKKMVATWGEPTVLALVDEFFTTTHPRVVRSDYSVGALFQCAQHLIVANTGQTLPDQRTAENVDAASRATRRR